jgi:hypothetical protein
MTFVPFAPKFAKPVQQNVINTMPNTAVAAPKHAGCVRKCVKSSCLIPSIGRGAVDGAVAGRGFFAILNVETPPYTLPREEIAQAIALYFI